MRKPKPRPVGRPPLPPGERRQSIEVTLPAAVIERLRAIGKGNVSLGIQRAVESWLEGKQ